MTKTFKKVMTFLLGLTMLGGAVGGAVLANPAGGGLELKAVEGYDWDFTTKVSSNSNYMNTWTYGGVVEISGGANNNAGWAYIRTGGKGSDSRKIDPATMVSVNPSPVNIDSVNLQAVTVASGSGFSMDAVTLYVSTDKSFASVTDTVSGVTVSTNMTFTPTSGTYWESGSYFKLEFDWSGTSTSNRGMDVEKVLFNEAASTVTLTGLEAIIGEENLYTTDVLDWEDFLVVATKGDGTDVTVEDVTASIGDGTDFRPVEWGVTQPLVTDTTVRFTSLLANTSGDYESVDVTIHVSEPVIAQITISGDMVTKSYAVGAVWDPTGLTVTGTLSPEGTIDLTNEVAWSYDPATAELGTTEVKVTATYNELVSETTITGITVVNEITDTITGNDVPSGGSYNDWTYDGSTAKYAINSNYGVQTIQLRSSNSNSGIVSTVSGGRIKSITIEWGISTAATRNLNIYASNSPYSAPTDLYSGSYIAQLNKGNNETTYEFTEEYSYVGVRSASSALYLDSITFVWQADVVTSVESVEVVGTMNKTSYYTNEEWKGDGLSVNLHYSDGAVSNITSGYTLTWNPATPVLGTEQVSVTATYNNVTSDPVTFNVTVQEYIEPVYSFHPTADPEGFTDSAGSFTGEGLDWNFYMTGAGAKAQSFDPDKGLHFGSGNYPADTVTLYSDIFAATTGETMINRIVVNASSANDNDGAVTMTIKVNNEVVNTITLTKTATDYSTVLDTPVWGSVEIVLTNGGKKAAMYFGGIDIFAETDATVTASLVAAVNGLLDFRTCEIDATSVEFGTWLDANKTIIEENREVLTNLVAHDYESMDTTYTGNKTSIVNVLAKYDACVARYEVANGALAPTIFGNEDTTIAVVVVIITLAAITALVGFYYYDKRRRVNK